MMSLEEFQEWKKSMVKIRYIDFHGNDQGGYLYRIDNFGKPGITHKGHPKCSDAMLYVRWDNEALEWFEVTKPPGA